MWRFNIVQWMFPYAVPRACHLLVRACSRVGWWRSHAHAVLCVCLCASMRVGAALFYVCRRACVCLLLLSVRVCVVLDRPLSIRQAFLLAYLSINNMWKSISEKRQCSAKSRHNAQHNKHKSIRCATKRIKARTAALTTRLCLMHAKSEAYDT